MTLRAYSAYCRDVGPQEGAVLVFAPRSKDARKLAFPTLNDWFDLEWIDVATDWLPTSARWLAEQEGVDLEGEPRLIESPKACNRCDRWGAPIDTDGVCQDCRDAEEPDGD